MNRHTAPRLAFTLIELMIALVICGVLFGMVATLLSRTIAAGAVATEHLRGVVALGTLGQQFRRDVRASRNVSLDDVDGRPRLVLESTELGRVEYVVTPEGLARTQNKDATAKRQELFHLPPLKVVDFKSEDAGSQGRHVVSILIVRTTPVPGNDDVASGQFEVTAIGPRALLAEATP